MTKEEAEASLAQYSTQVIEIDTGHGRWKHLDVEIFKGDQKIGSYRRNLSELIDTFVPFLQAGQFYALYSPNYTTTRIMRLDTCEDLGGEEPSGGGFCPAEYYIPYEPDKGLYGQWGFISGCVWGDDRSMKIQYLDLSNAAQGILKRTAKFGYLEMPRTMSLRQAVDLSYFNAHDPDQEIEFSVRRVYSMKHNKFEDEGYDEENTITSP